MSCPTPVKSDVVPITRAFRDDVCTLEDLRDRMPVEASDRLFVNTRTGRRAETCDLRAASTAMKQWARDRGATHVGDWGSETETTPERPLAMFSVTDLLAVAPTADWTDAAAFIRRVGGRATLCLIASHEPTVVVVSEAIRRRADIALVTQINRLPGSGGAAALEVRPVMERRLELRDARSPEPDPQRVDRAFTRLATDLTVALHALGRTVVVAAQRTAEGATVTMDESVTDLADWQYGLAEDLMTRIAREYGFAPHVAAGSVLVTGTLRLVVARTDGSPRFAADAFAAWSLVAALDRQQGLIRSLTGAEPGKIAADDTLATTLGIDEPSHDDSSIGADAYGPRIRVTDGGRGARQLQIILAAAITDAADRHATRVERVGEPAANRVLAQIRNEHGSALTGVSDRAGTSRLASLCDPTTVAMFDRYGIAEASDLERWAAQVAIARTRHLRESAGELVYRTRTDVLPRAMTCLGELGRRVPEGFDGDATSEPALRTLIDDVLDALREVNQRLDPEHVPTDPGPDGFRDAIARLSGRTRALTGLLPPVSSRPHPDRLRLCG